MTDFGRCKWVALRRRRYVQCPDYAFSAKGLCPYHHRDWEDMERKRIIRETGVDPYSLPEEDTRPLGFDVRGMGFDREENPFRWNPEASEEDPSTVNIEEFPPHLLRELLECRLQRNGINSKIKRYYTIQYDNFWSLTPMEWAQVVIDALTNPDGYNYDHYRSSLKNRPRDISRDSVGGYYATRNDIQALRTLDWQISDWLYAAEQLGLMKPGEFSVDSYF